MDYGSRAEVRFDQIRLQTSGSQSATLVEGLGFKGLRGEEFRV